MVSYLAAQLPTDTCRDFKAGTLESGDVEGSSFQGRMGLQGTSPVDHAQSVLVTEDGGTTKLQQSPHRGEDGGRQVGELRRKMVMLVMTLRAWRLEASLSQMAGGGQCLQRPS